MQTEMNNEIVTYEHPMNERIRNLLRFEHLYNIFDYRMNNDIQKNYSSEVFINQLIVNSLIIYVY